MNYNSTEIIIFTLLLYFLTWLAVKFKMLNLANHRKIWNIILATTFLVCGILGLCLAIFIDNEITISWYTTSLWIHVEFGITMALIAFLHFIWHLKYYLNILKIKK